MNSSLTPTAAVTVLAATAAAAAGTYISAPLFAGLLKSTPFLWASANVIIIVIWLLSSSRRSNMAADNTASSPAGHAGDVLRAVDDLYPPSDYEGYSSSVVSSGEGPVASTPRRQAREARAARRADRPRVPKPKPAGEAAAASTRTAAAMEPRARPDASGDKKSRDVHEVPLTPRTVAAAAAVEAKPEDDDDVSLDSLWQSMLQRRAVRPVSVKKSETWGNDELPHLQRAAETAAQRREMRKSASTAVRPPQPPPPQEAAAAAPATASAARQLGWRTRDVLMRAHDDLLRRAESLIRRHHDDLRLQRQESDQRRAMELQQRGRPAPLIRV